MKSSNIFYPAFIVAAALVCPIAPYSAYAEASYPSQTIKLLVPNPPGGLPDTIARIVGQRLQEKLGQPVVVENRPGANAGIGTATLTSLPPDGYTFLLTDGSILSINPVLYKKLPYDPKDVLPVSFVARAPIFLAANAKVPVANLNELIAYAKAHPGQLTYGSIGVGSFHHLSMEAMKAALGLNIIHVPFKGSGESVGALLGGHVDLLFSSYAALRGAIETKQVKLLATNAARRSAQAPNVPPVADFIPGFDLAVMQGVFARVGTPTEIVQKISMEVASIVREPDVVRQFEVAGIEPVGGAAEEFGAALKNEIERVFKVAKAADIKAN